MTSVHTCKQTCNYDTQKKIHTVAAWALKNTTNTKRQIKTKMLPNTDSETDSTTILINWTLSAVVLESINYFPASEDKTLVIYW